MTTDTDIILDIATGKGRNETSWQNKKVSWSALVDRLRTVHRTAETHAEYMAMTKTRQDEIKDVGGFVGGLLVGGRRSKTSVLHRSLLTLDLDSAPVGFWQRFLLYYDCAACLYSTHKHTPENPRYRLLVPLARTVDPTEYEALGRWIGGELDIEAFDHTGFQHERLMYWPSTSKDGVYEFEVTSGPLLDPDEILRNYADYRDSSQWPVSSKVNERIDREIKKQGDPLEKRGIIGAFCRAYDIREAIETFLSDVYEPAGDRYTYVRGSTGKGLVVYGDNRWVYSNHGTDPVSGRLCNAFDLVRLHKFGLQDEESAKGTATTKLPSYKSMLDFVRRDPNVKVLIGQEMQERAEEIFRETWEQDNPSINVDSADTELLGIPCVPELPAEDSPEEEERQKKWLALLERDTKTELKTTIHNMLLILRNDRLLAGRIGYNEFQGSIVVLGKVPWDVEAVPGRAFNDADAEGLRYYIETVYGIHSRDKLKDATGVASRMVRFHPVRNYLNSLTWDGRPRLTSLLAEFMGAEATDYTAAVTRTWFAAAVTRIFRPGCKFDNVLTFQGIEGIYKSTFFRILAAPWFSDDFSFHMIGTNKAIEQLAGKWVVEVPELSGFRKAELEGIKAFLSRQVDRQRGAYKEFVTERPRQNVFAASTNDPAPLKGSTGNRRFWIVAVNGGLSERLVTELMAIRDQLWAEAVTLYRQRHPLYLPVEMEIQARQMQEQFTETDEREEAIRAYLDKPLPDNWENMTHWDRRAYLNGDSFQNEGSKPRERVTVAEIWTECLGCAIKDLNPVNGRPINDIMRKIEGWERVHSLKIKGRVTRGYRRKR